LSGRLEPVTQLRGERLLIRADGVRGLRCLRRSLPTPPIYPLGLEEFEWLLMRALDELARHPLPRAAVHLGPDEHRQREPLNSRHSSLPTAPSGSSNWSSLPAQPLTYLEHGSLFPSAITARSLFEIAATSDPVHRTILPIWRGVTSSPKVRDAAITNHDLWDAIWEARLGTRVAGDDWPKAVNVLTRLKRFARGDELFKVSIDSVYDILCDAAHPNIGSQDVFWRRAPRDCRGWQRVLRDAAASESPVKLAIVNAVRISTG
jgi:hypothetical protein